jgi:hypothetical protein
MNRRLLSLLLSFAIAMVAALLERFHDAFGLWSAAIPAGRSAGFSRRGWQDARL